MVKASFRYSFFALLLALQLPATSVAQEKIEPPKNAFGVRSIFGEEKSPTGFFRTKVKKVVHVEEPKEEPAVKEEEKEADPIAEMKKAVEVVPNDPSKHILPPDQTEAITVKNPHAPGSFTALNESLEEGDYSTAKVYARQFVRYQKKLMFRVREITKMVGEALIAERVIDDEDWDGVEQYLNIQFAKSRDESPSPLKVTHEDAMQQVAADGKGRADIYFFFSLDCSWCRKMAPDVERLWRVVKKDKNVRMVGLTMGTHMQDWIRDYRSYTGMSVPIYEGTKLAEHFNIKFAPALVIVAPTTGVAYVKTGKQDFSRMYEFVKKVQGLPTALSPDAKRLLRLPIGEVERLEQKKNLPRGVQIVKNGTSAKQVKLQRTSVQRPAGKRKDKLERF